uniref:Monooxygenase, DBH-like 1, like n=1 Tax=Myripristis murdjan TaxID=586833 RepID=A0A668A0Y1_9TELE
ISCYWGSMHALLLLLSLFLARPTGAGALNDSVLPFMEYLDPDRNVSLKWGFNDAQGTITFSLSIKSTGWVSLGFSPNGGMEGADIVMGGIGPGGAYFTDRHATGNILPVVDKQQNYTLLSLTEIEGQTTMTFQRAIQSCDDDDFHITARPIKLIYAYGTNDELNYHGKRRGTKEINLLNYMPRITLPSTDYLTITVDNINIPATHTHYHCMVMKLPKLKGKHHIYRIEPIIEHHDIVHHMLLYGCPSFVNETYNGPCYRGDTGDHCFRVVAAWAVGGGVYEFPENAGIPVGGESGDTFYRLEIHYNNPAREEGRRDSSGLRLYYTAQLRQHDASVLTTGLLLQGNLDYSIPANATQFHTYGMCNTSLFSKLEDAPVPDLHVFALELHTHLAGRKVRVGHFRNGTQIDFLALNENYNFEMQQITNLGNIKTIKQGDNIVVECTYNTVNRTGDTKMGLATTDEMCLAFLFYYPANNIDTCWSHPTTHLSDMADSHNMSWYPKGTMMDMMKTPSVNCQMMEATSAPNSNPTFGRASGRLSTSWAVTLTGLLLLWAALM